MHLTGNKLTREKTKCIHTHMSTQKKWLPEYLEIGIYIPTSHGKGRDKLSIGRINGLNRRLMRGFLGKQMESNNNICLQFL